MARAARWLPRNTPDSPDVRSVADDAALIERAVADLLGAGYRTADIMQPGAEQTSTSGMGEALVEGLEKLAG